MMLGLSYTLNGLAVFLVVITLLPLSKLRRGWIRVWEFPRIQIFWIAAGGAMLGVFLPQAHLVTAVLALIALVQLLYIAKFTPLWVRQSVTADAALRAQTDSHISVISANIKKSNRDYDAVAQMLRRHDADVVTIIEGDAAWAAALRERVGDQYAHWVDVPKDNGYGISVLSQLSLSDVEVRETVTRDIPSLRMVVTLRSGVPLRLYVVHPEPPVINHDTRGRDSEIAQIGFEVAYDPLPALVTGDLNDVAWSTTTRSFQRLSGLLDPRVGRGFFNTFNAFHWWARWPLDYLFHDPQFRFLDMARLEKVGSDHFPVLFCVALAQAPAQDSDPGELDAGEEGEIKQMIVQERARPRTPIGSDWED